MLDMSHAGGLLNAQLQQLAAVLLYSPQETYRYSQGRICTAETVCCPMAYNSNLL